MTERWENLHDPQVAWRQKIIGDINGLFVVPRYVEVFGEAFADARGWSFFEIGSGNGDMSAAMLNGHPDRIGRYVCSECFEEGVDWLHRRGLEAVRADAQALPSEDGAFDAVVEFDVMHHVDRPRDMAREMMRVARRGRLLLVESNGLSVFRKLKELTPGHRAAGERSYTPRSYRGFFEGHPGFEVTGFRIYPFLFPFKVPKALLPALAAFNRAIERVPFFRWQCSSVVIIVDYRRV